MNKKISQSQKSKENSLDSSIISEWKISKSIGIKKQLPSIQKNQVIEHSSSKIQHQAQQQYQKPLDMSQIEFQNFRKCQICYQNIHAVSSMSIGQCSHYFCKKCLVQHIKSNLTQGKEITCPYENCKQTLRQQKISFQDLSKQDIIVIRKAITVQKILKIDDILLCKNTTCYGQYQITSGKCNLCNQRYCNKCQQFYHEGPCLQQIAIRLQEDQLFRQCKKCKMVVERNGGCSHMTCTCGHNFCYYCGQNYSPNHKCIKSNNFLREIRKQMQKKLFFEGDSLNFERFYKYMRTSYSSTSCEKFFWIIFYMLLIYPFTMSIGLVLVNLTFALTAYFIILVASVLPFLEIVANSQDADQMFPPFMKKTTCRKILSILIILVFYPLFYFWSLKYSYQLIVLDNQAEVLWEVLKGFRLIALMPLLIC